MGICTDCNNRMRYYTVPRELRLIMACVYSHKIIPSPFDPFFILRKKKFIYSICIKRFFINPSFVLKKNDNGIFSS